MKDKENKSKGTDKKGSAKRLKCPWVVVPNTLQNILFPSQISSVNINVEKRIRKIRALCS